MMLDIGQHEVNAILSALQNHLNVTTSALNSVIAQVQPPPPAAPTPEAGAVVTE